jgi:hypothetical protein
VFIYIYLSGNKIEKNEMGEACRAYEGGQRRVQFWWGIRMEKDHWGDPNICGRIILKWML